MGEAAIQIGPERTSAFLDRVKEMLPEGGNLDLCLTCGACASGCPATGLAGMDPRKFLRMAALGLDEEITSTSLGLDVQHVPALHLCLPHGDRHFRPWSTRRARPGPVKSGPRASWAPATWPCAMKAAAPWAPRRMILPSSSRMCSKRSAKPSRVRGAFRRRWKSRAPISS
jgi:ferredoxin